MGLTQRERLTAILHEYHPCPGHDWYALHIDKTESGEGDAKTTNLTTRVVPSDPPYIPCEREAETLLARGVRVVDVETLAQAHRDVFGADGPPDAGDRSVARLLLDALDADD